MQAGRPRGNAARAGAGRVDGWCSGGQAHGQSTLHGGPVMLCPIRAALCYICQLLLLALYMVNILVKTSSFYLERFQRYGVLKNMQLFRPTL